MATDADVKFVQDVLENRHQILRRQLGQLITVVTLDSRPNKLHAAKAAKIANDDLGDLLPQNRRPNWMADLNAALEAYIRMVDNDATAGRVLFEGLMNVRPQIDAHTWKNSSIDCIDVAAVLNAVYVESELNSAFDELVQELQEILDTGLVDSIKARESLEMLIATIRKNSSSFSTARTMWDVVKIYGKHLVRDVLESTPGIKHFVKAARQTMEEIDMKFVEVHESATAKFLEVVQKKLRLRGESPQDIPSLEYKPGSGLPAPDSIESEIVDVEPEPVAESPAESMPTPTISESTERGGKL